MNIVNAGIIQKQTKKLQLTTESPYLRAPFNKNDPCPLRRTLLKL